MTVLTELVRALEAAAVLAQSTNRNHVAWGLHLAEDARGVRLIAEVWREPADAVNGFSRTTAPAFDDWKKANGW